MTLSCEEIRDRYGDKIQEIVDIQRQENREAIFFIYDNLSTSEIYRGKATQINLRRDQRARILSRGNLVGSIHSHPSGFDPSTIDLMTGLLTSQDVLCVAVPINETDVDEDHVITCMDLSNLTFFEKRRMARSMRRSSVALTQIGHQVRKQINMQRFNVKGCRTHKIKVEGVEYPAIDRPSKFRLVVGEETGVEEIEGDHDYYGE